MAYKKTAKLKKSMKKMDEILGFDKDDYDIDNVSFIKEAQGNKYDEDEAFQCFSAENHEYSEPIYDDVSTDADEFQSIGILPQFNPKTDKLSQIALSIIAENCLKVLNENKIMRYEPDKGCYIEIPMVRTFIESQISSEASSRLKTMEIDEIIRKIQRNPALQAKAEDFSSNPHLINCENGVVDFSGKEQDGIALLKHDEKYMFHYSVKCRYIEDTTKLKTEAFDKFCATSLDNDSEKRKLLLTLLGCIFGDFPFKYGIFFLGMGDTGKSILSNVIEKFFQKEVVSNVPLEGLDNSFNRNTMLMAKINICSEIKAKKLSDITFFKRITGGDEIVSEEKGKTPFPQKCKARLIFAGNQLMGTTEYDPTEAFPNRLAVLLFNKPIPKEQQDRNLVDKLYEERDSIFTLAVRALPKLMAASFKLDMPAESVAFIDAFRRSENSVAAFLEDEVEIMKDVDKHREFKVFNKELTEAYVKYCIKNGFEAYGLHKFNEFLKLVPGITAGKARDKDGKNRHCRFGIRLKN